MSTQTPAPRADSQIPHGTLDEQYTYVHGRVIEHRNSAEHHLFEMGRWLATMRDYGLYKAHYESFEEYIEDACLVGRRQAYTYIDLYNTYIKSGLLRRLDGILDSVKVQEICGVRLPTTPETETPVAATAAAALGSEKLSILAEVMEDEKIPIEEKVGWIYEALQERNKNALKRRVVQEYRIPRGQQVIQSCFTCANAQIVYSGSRLGEYLVGTRGIMACHKHQVLVSSLSAEDAHRIASGDGDRSGCPSYIVSPEWKMPDGNAIDVETDHALPKGKTR